MDEDLKKTEQFTDVRWLPAVETPDELPTAGVRNGDLCVVAQGNVIYEFIDGEWRAEIVSDVVLTDD